ncbi:hypothetical protein [Ramlibacter sp. AN1133]|uniref:hypothetical protein n=1 Tax=Ramlibacter sp. AN1133 TaxID=3133429 RepID=UPI0030C22326
MIVRLAAPCRCVPVNSDVSQHMSQHALIGIAGVHYVASELSRRGLIALPTTKNLPAFDILVSNVDGTKHANIQVKASSKRVAFFPMPPAEKVRTGGRDVYVLVRWLESEARYQGFLLTGKQARAAVEDACDRQRVNIRNGTRTKEFPTVHVGLQLTPAAVKWERAWKNWNL